MGSLLWKSNLLMANGQTLTQLKILGVVQACSRRSWPIPSAWHRRNSGEVSTLGAWQGHHMDAHYTAMNVLPTIKFRRRWSTAAYDFLYKKKPLSHTQPRLSPLPHQWRNTTNIYIYTVIHSYTHTHTHT